MKYHIGNHHRHIQSWVFGMIEEQTGRCVFWLVENRKRETLLPIIASHITRGSTIKSDQFTPYLTLGSEGFEHLSVSHSMEFVNEDGIHTQAIESAWSQIKSIIKVKRGTVEAHLQGILDYYSFIYVAKFEGNSRLDAFLELIQANNYY